jgi:molybdenum cofactor cytidylyltransferase
MYALAQELARAGRRVAITTTTHIMTPYAGQAEGPWLWGQGQPSRGELTHRLVPGRPLVIVSVATAAGKLKGLTPAQVMLLACEDDLFILVEADGAAQLPLKGWAAHEPIIPAQTQLVVAVIGASGLGRPLRAETVHRTEAFAAAAGLSPGDVVTPQAMALVLAGEAGPLRGLPPGARAVMVLNQDEAVSPADREAFFTALARSGVFAKLLRGSLRSGRLEPWGGRG